MNMNYWDWDIEKIRSYRVIICEGLNNGKCKEVYDYLLNRKISVEAVVSQQGELYNGHFQDIKIVSLSEGERLISDKFCWIVCEENSSTEKIINTLKLLSIPVYIFDQNSVVIENEYDYVDDDGNRIINESGNKIPKVIFSGKGNELFIGRDVKLGNSVRLELHNHSKICIEAYSKVGKDTSIIVYDHSNCTFGKYVAIGSECNLSSRYMSNVEVRNEVQFADGCMVFNKYDSLVKIGDQTTFEKRTNIISVSGAEVVIGNGCMFSFDTSVICNDGHGIFDISLRQRVNRNKSILIGDRVWGGIKSTILGGAVLGDDIVIGANSVVNKEYKNSNCILVGNPAREVRREIVWERYLL